MELLTSKRRVGTMGRLLWVLAIAVAFGVGLAIGLFGRGSEKLASDDGATPVAALKLEVQGLRVQIQERDAQVNALRQRLQILSETEPVDVPLPLASATTMTATDQEPAEERQDEETEDAQDETAAEDPPAAPTEEAALDRFYQYLQETDGMRWGERMRRARALLDELRAMGEPAVTALLRTIEDSEVARERGTAAALLGALHDPRSLAVLQELVEHEEDLLVRRAAARGLQLLQAPEAIPVLETIVENNQEDRFVRMSAAYGLAQLGEPKGTAGLVQIFDEAEGDGRGRYLAFQALTALNDADTLPLMRRLTNSTAELSYRLGAIQYLADYGDKEALPFLQQVLASPADEQPSVVEAAEQAFETISSRR